MFQKITIIGIGLMGSSFARAVKLNGLAKEVVAFDNDEENLKIAIDLNVIDAGYNSIQSAIKNADLIVFATPVGCFDSISSKISSLVEPDTIITDLGSVKSSVVDVFKRYFKEKNIVPAHPISGSEKAGAKYGRADLFKDRWCILTPLENTDPSITSRMKKLWESLGSQVEIMLPKQHDVVLAMTSHLPHLLSYSLVDTAVNAEDNLNEDIIRFSAGGFRDFTRLAGSDPIMWRDICIKNKDAILEIMSYFKDNLKKHENMIENECSDDLENLFSKTKDVRKKVIDAKQDIDGRGCR